MVLKVFPKGDFLGLLICCSQNNSDQVTLKIPFVAISFKSNLRMTGLMGKNEFCTSGAQMIPCSLLTKKTQRPS